MSRFIILISLSGIFILAGMALAFEQGIIVRMPSFRYEIIVLMSMVTIVLYHYLRNVKSDMFVQLYLLTMVVKMLAAITFCFVMVFLDRSGSMTNLVFFMAVYIIFTAMEIGFLYKK